METRKNIHFTAELANGNDNTYGATWWNLVREYLITAYSKENAEAEVILDGITYKVLKRNGVTAFYDADGNTLFDVENARLEREYGQLMDIPESEDEVGDSGPIAPMEKTIAGTYATGADKLRNEENKMLESVKPEYKAAMQSQLDLMFSELIEQTEQDAEFEKKVLLSHKSMERCMKFCADKARELREPSDKEKENARRNNVPIVTPVGSTMLFDWIKEYYDMDDKDEIEKEAKNEADAKKRKAEANKKADARETAAKKKKEQKDKAKAVPEKKKAIVKEPELRKKEMENQLSLFDLVGV